MSKFLYALAFTFTAYGQHPIVYAISTPRSLSVAFLRIAQGLGFDMFQEPSLWAYNKVHYYELSHAWYKPDAPQSFAEVQRMLVAAAQAKPVFAKEMSFAVEGFLTEDNELIHNPDVHFVFLVRNPHAVTVSWYKAQPLVHDTLAHVFGYKSLYNLFQYIKQHAANPPIIILTEDLYTYPEQTLGAWCERIHVPWNSSALTWTSRTDDHSGFTDWHETKLSDATHHWHAGAIQSEGLSKPRTYAVDVDGNPTFEEIAPEHREAFVEAYMQSKPYYDLLLNER